MRIQMSRSREMLMLLAIFFSNTIIMVDTILTPLYSNIYAMFGDHVALVNFALTGCYIIVIVLSLVVGKICDRFNKKLWLAIGAVFGLVGGAGMLLMTATTMLISRVLLMIAYSITQPVAMAFITEMYEEEKRRDTVIGFYNSSMTFFGIVFPLIAGILATQSVFNAYCLHLSIAIYLVLLIFFVPSMKTVKVPAHEEAGSLDAPSEKRGKLGGAFWGVTINFTFNALTFCAVVYFLSFYVSQNALGTETMSGALNSINNVLGFLVPLAFGLLVRKLGWTLGPLGYLVQTVGIIVLFIHPSVAAAFIGMGLMGAGNAIIRSDVMADIAKVLPVTSSGFGFSIFVCAGTLATVLSSYFVTGVMGAMGMTFTQFLIFPIIIGIANVIVGFFVSRGISKRNAAEMEGGVAKTDEPAA